MESSRRWPYAAQEQQVQLGKGLTFSGGARPGRDTPAMMVMGLEQRDGKDVRFFPARPR